MKRLVKIFRRQAKIIGEGIQESEFRRQKEVCLPIGRRIKDFAQIAHPSYSLFHTQRSMGSDAEFSRLTSDFLPHKRFMFYQ